MRHPDDRPRCCSRLRADGLEHQCRRGSPAPARDGRHRRSPRRQRPDPHGLARSLLAVWVARSGGGLNEDQVSSASKGYLLFLKEINRSIPKNKELHLVVDNYATHKYPEVQAWLRKHTRFHIHYTPISASWLNLVERRFGLLTERCVRRGVFTSVAELKQAVRRFLDAKKKPKPFRWIKIRATSYTRSIVVKKRLTQDTRL